MQPVPSDLVVGVGTLAVILLLQFLLLTKTRFGVLMQATACSRPKLRDVPPVRLHRRTQPVFALSWTAVSS